MNVVSDSKNLLDFLAAQPRCPECNGTGRVPHTSAAGVAAFIVCSCVRWDEPAYQAAIGVGATTEPPRQWPAHVQQDADRHGVFVHCTHCGRAQYVTDNARRIVARAGNEAAWTWAMKHADCVRVTK